MINTAWCLAPVPRVLILSIKPRNLAESVYLDPSIHPQDTVRLPLRPIIMDLPLEKSRAESYTSPDEQRTSPAYTRALKDASPTAVQNLASSTSSPYGPWSMS